MSTVESFTCVPIISACMRRDGTPTFVRTDVSVTDDERANGVHYYLAEAELLEAGFEEPFVHFDDREAPPFLAAAIIEPVAAAVTVPQCLTDNPTEER